MEYETGDHGGNDYFFGIGSKYGLFDADIVLIDFILDSGTFWMLEGHGIEIGI